MYNLIMNISAISHKKITIIFRLTHTLLTVEMFINELQKAAQLENPNY